MWLLECCFRISLNKMWIFSFNTHICLTQVIQTQHTSCPCVLAQSKCSHTIPTLYKSAADAIFLICFSSTAVADNTGKVRFIRAFCFFQDQLGGAASPVFYFQRAIFSPIIWRQPVNIYHLLYIIMGSLWLSEYVGKPWLIVVGFISGGENESVVTEINICS